jgi:hypothetical protein
LLKKESNARNDSENKKIKESYLTQFYIDPQSPLQSIRSEMKSVRAKREEVDKEVPNTMISKELEKPRPTYVLFEGSTINMVIQWCRECLQSCRDCPKQTRPTV